MDVKEKFEDGTYKVTLKQSTKPTPGQDTKQPLVLPIRLAAFDKDGTEVIPEQIEIFSKNRATLKFKDLDEKPVLSINRGFSAPVTLGMKQSTENRLLLMAKDTDPFNAWEAGYQTAMDNLVGMVANDDAPDPRYIDAIGDVLTDSSKDPAFRAFNLTLPSEDSIAAELFAKGHLVDATLINECRATLLDAIGSVQEQSLRNIYAQMKVAGPYNPAAEDAGKRALASAALSLITRTDKGALATELFDKADNMTEAQSALSCLIRANKAGDALESFYEKWKDDKLVTDKWFALQAANAPARKAVDVTRKLSEHPEFHWTNPNRFRSLIGAFATNQAGFHRADGAGYEFLTDWLIKLDAKNPQTTARMCGLFETWRRNTEGRQEKISACLERIASNPEISKDTSEIIGKIRAA